MYALFAQAALDITSSLKAGDRFEFFNAKNSVYHGENTLNNP